MTDTQTRPAPPPENLVPVPFSIAALIRNVGQALGEPIGLVTLPEPLSCQVSGVTLTTDRGPTVCYPGAAAPDWYALLVISHLVSDLLTRDSGAPAAGRSGQVAPRLLADTVAGLQLAVRCEEAAHGARAASDAATLQHHLQVLRTLALDGAGTGGGLSADASTSTGAASPGRLERLHLLATIYDRLRGVVPLRDTLRDQCLRRGLSLGDARTVSRYVQLRLAGSGHRQVPADSSRLAAPHEPGFPPGETSAQAARWVVAHVRAVENSARLHGLAEELLAADPQEGTQAGLSGAAHRAS